MPLEGGFQGRTNKLVDSCYSYWMAALFPMIAPHTAAPLRTSVCNSAWAGKARSADGDTLFVRSRRLVQSGGRPTTSCLTAVRVGPTDVQRP